MDPSSLGAFEGLYHNFVNFYQVWGLLEGTLVLIILGLGFIIFAKTWRDRLVTRIFVYIFGPFFVIFLILMILMSIGLL